MTLLEDPPVTTLRRPSPRDGSSPQVPAVSSASWSSGPCAALNHRFRVACDVPELVRDHLAPLLRPLRSDGPLWPHARYHVVYSDNPLYPYALYYRDGEHHSRLALASRPGTITSTLAWHLNQLAVERTAHTHVLLHAAAATRAGVTVLLPGDQEYGKTTTVAGLLREGFRYVTDETVALDPRDGSVTPFPKALSLDPGSWPLFPEARPAGAEAMRQWQVPASSLCAEEELTPVPAPRVVVFPRYVAGSRTELSPLSRAEAVRRLVQSTFRFKAAPGRNLRTLAAVANGATVATLCIGSLAEAVLAVEELVSTTIIEELVE